jgi:uncharacterized protein YjbI with pentapeptide repeats
VVKSDVAEGNLSLISATNESKVTIAGTSLSGRAVVGLLCDSGAEIECSSVTFSEIDGTGAALTNRAALRLTACTFDMIGRSAIEAHDAVVLELTGCQFSSIGLIGVMAKSNVRGSVVDTTFEQCGSACAHFADLCGDFQVKSSVFSESDGNGVNLRNVRFAFEDCRFVGNISAGAELRGATTVPIFRNCHFGRNEAGTRLSGGCSPAFVRCEFAGNHGVGASIGGAAPTFYECNFAENFECGVQAADRSLATFEKCKVRRNQICGVQIEGRGTEIVFDECEFTEQRQANGVIVEKGALVEFTKAIFIDNVRVHLEVKNAGKVVVEDSAFSGEQTEFGVIVFERGEADIKRSRIQDTIQTGIIAGVEGQLVCEECCVSLCRGNGMTFMENSTGELIGSTIQENGRVGIEIATETVRLTQNHVEKNGRFGVKFLRVIVALQGNEIKDNIDANVRAE